MQTEILHLNNKEHPKFEVKSILSFEPFISFLRHKKSKNNLVRNGYLSYVISQFEQHPEMMHAMDIEHAKDFPDELQLIYNTLCPILEDEEAHFWSLSLPLKPSMFYSTNAFHTLFKSFNAQRNEQQQEFRSSSERSTQQLIFAYSTILEKCYNIHSFFSTSFVESISDANTGQIKFYRLNIDTRFIEVKASKEIPEIKIENLRSRVGYDHNEVLPLLQRILPLDMFSFEGFGITTIKDITDAYAIENIKNILLDFSATNEEKCFVNIDQSLKALVSDKDIEFGVIPILMVNGKIIFDKTVFANSMLMHITGAEDLVEKSYMEIAKKYYVDPKPVIYKTITTQDESKKDFLKLLKREGIKSYALLPIFTNKNLCGVLEVYCRAEDRINEDVLAQLDPAMPLLAQLLVAGVHAFEEEIEQVIKDKFTSLQPAVQWKFNEAAWHYMRDRHLPGGKTDIEDIDFTDVYPLYGAVDIRNSTINRNAALCKDLEIQFTILIGVLKELKERSGFGLLDEKIFLTKQWLQEVSNPDTFYKQIDLDQYLENNIVPFLHDFLAGNPQYANIIEKYFTAIDINKGVAGENRRLLEESMTTIISAVNFYLESMKGEIQTAYPCYFEKFRTDGIEYDIYIGQTIAPDKPFSDIYLKNLRLLQLTSMAAIAKYTHSLISTLAIPIETTQLIFIHSNQIDIKFRTDEKRFDVEGAYNIRYHIVKKRIDKAFIKGTAERLTQPNKIAIVYFTQQEAVEYKGYIGYLQQKHLLTDEIEDLELEEMQGVNGLRALRVSVQIP